MVREKPKTMEEFHCEMLELSLRFSSEEMDQEAFLKALGIEKKEDHVDEDGDLLISLTFNEHEEGTDYHAHMRVRFFNDGRNLIDLRYHHSTAAPATADEKPPYAEDCAQWLGNFFKSDRVPARISAAYTYDKSYSPVVSLPFPLLSSEKALVGSVVTGLSIVIPKENPESVIIQIDDDGDMMLFFNMNSELNLVEFKLLNELMQLSPSVESLVKKAGR